MRFLNLFESTPLTLENFSDQAFFALKAMIDKGDEFKQDDTRFPHKRHSSGGCQFIYKGTRRIAVIYMALFDKKGGVVNMSVDILEGFDEERRVKPIGQNMWKREGRTKFFLPAEEKYFDPVIRTIPDLVSFVQSTLDRDDRDRDVYHRPTPVAPKSKSPVDINR